MFSLHAIWSFTHGWLQCKEAFIKVMKVLVKYLEAVNVGSCIRAMHWGHAQGQHVPLCMTTMQCAGIKMN